MSLHAQTKQTYKQSFETFKDNERVFKNIENLTGSSVSQPCKPRHSDHQAILKKHYETQIERINAKHREETASLNQELQALKGVVSEQQGQLDTQEESLRSCVEEKKALEEELMNASERFSDAVSEIELAKEKERSVYEESIVRLLSNLDQREYLKRQ